MTSNMYESLTSEQRDVMIACLFLANHKEKEWEWKGMIHKCKAGEFKTSLASIKKLCSKGVSIKMIRTALKKLEKWGFLANKGAKEGRIITIIKWDTYQGHYNEEGKDVGRIGAKVGQSEGKGRATNKNVKKVKNDKNVKKDNIGNGKWKLPEEINPEAWKEFEKHRKGTKNWSNRARTLNANVLKGNSFKDQQEIVDKSIRSGWPGLFPEKQNKPTSSGVKAKHGKYDKYT